MTCGFAVLTVVPVGGIIPAVGTGIGVGVGIRLGVIDGDMVGGCVYDRTCGGGNPGIAIPAIPGFDNRSGIAAAIAVAAIIRALGCIPIPSMC